MARERPGSDQELSGTGDLIDGLIFDAIRLRLIEIGEAVKRICPELLQTESDIPWEDIAGMRDCLAHRYFDTSHAIKQATLVTFRTWKPPFSDFDPSKAAPSS